MGSLPAILAKQKTCELLYFKKVILKGSANLIFLRIQIAKLNLLLTAAFFLNTVQCFQITTHPNAHLQL